MIYLEITRTDNAIMSNCQFTSEILPVIFFSITCESVLHVKHLSITWTENYKGDIINYVHTEIFFGLIQWIRQNSKRKTSFKLHFCWNARSKQG